MPTIAIDLPEGALSALRVSLTEFVREMRIAAALHWYSHGEISQSRRDRRESSDPKCLTTAGG